MPVRSAALRGAVVLGCLALVAWVQRHALPAFFSSPEDLIHLQQAVGLKPTLATPLRFLSQVLYFRGMVRLFGLNPLAFHLVSLLTHLAIVVVSSAFLQGAGIRPRLAVLTALLFGMLPLYVTVLSSAVGMNDELALLLAVLALWMALRERPYLGAALFAAGLLCKESVLCLPLLLLGLRRQNEPLRAAWRRAAPLLAVAAAVGLLILALRPVGLAPGGPAYAMRVGSNLFHNLMTYTAWAVDLRDPMPDLVSSYSTSAWPVGLAVFGVLGLSCWKLPEARSPIVLGIAWWILGLIPVLPLRFQTYRHYLYPALPGLALAVSAPLASAAESLSAIFARSPAGRSAATAALLAACLLGYAIRSEQLIAARLSAVVAGTDLPLDPVMRRRVVAERAIGSMGQRIGPEPVRVAILSPRRAESVYGTRSGRANPSPPSTAYDLLRESVDHGGGLKLFFPQIDSVAFIDRWTPERRGDALFLSYPGGYLVGGGFGPAALEEITFWMFEAGWYSDAKEYLRSVLAAYPERATLRLAYAGALFQLGEREEARTQLTEVLRRTPARDSSAIRARWILDSMGEAPRPRSPGDPSAVTPEER